MTATKAKTKYKHILDFASHMGVSRSRAYQALESQNPNWWEEYAAYLQKRREDTEARLLRAKQIADNALRPSKMAERLNIEAQEARIDEKYGPEFKTFTK